MPNDLREDFSFHIDAVVAIATTTAVKVENHYVPLDSVLLRLLSVFIYFVREPTMIP